MDYQAACQNDFEIISLKVHKCVSLRVGIHVKVLFISHGQLEKRITCRCSFCRLSFSFGASKN